MLATYNRTILIVLAVALLVGSMAPMVMFETLNIAGLLDTDSIFPYANILLAALIPIVLISLGFALARFVVGFVQRVFNSLG